MRNLTLFSIFFIILLGFGSGNTTADYTENEIDIRYNVTNANEFITWYPFDGSGAFNLSFVDSLQVKVDDYSSLNSELNVSTDSANFTTSDIEADSALAFGYWNVTYDTGFVASTNWTNAEAEFSQNGLLNDFVMTGSEQIVTINDGNYSLSTISLYFTDGFQTTSLTYLEYSGLLVYANSSFLGYYLEIELNNIFCSSTTLAKLIEIPTSESSTVLGLPAPIIAVLTGISILILRYKTISRNS